VFQLWGASGAYLVKTGGSVFNIAAITSLFV
jgi:hypothetical protein